MIILKHFWIRNRIQKKVINVLKKPLFLALPYLGPLPLQSRTKLRKFLKGILDCCKLQILLKGQNILGNTFYFKDCILKELTSDVLSNFQCGLWNESQYGKCLRHLNIGIGEHIRISPLTKKKVKPKNSVVSNHLLLYNHSLSSESCSVVTKQNRKFVLELKGSPLIMRDKPSLNRNIRSAPSYLLERIQLRLTLLFGRLLLGFFLLDFKLLHHQR